MKLNDENPVFSQKLAPSTESDCPDRFARAIQSRNGPPRVNIDPDKPEKGLAKLVLSVVELLRNVLERQAIRKIETGNLSEIEIDRLGTALMNLEQKVRELQDHFQIDELNVNLGPLGKLND